MRATSSVRSSPVTQRMLVSIATYNERDNLAELIAAIHDELPHADVLVLTDTGVRIAAVKAIAAIGGPLARVTYPTLTELTKDEQADESLLDFLKERWKGTWPILYGDQLRQARLDEWIFQGVLDVEHLPAAEVEAVSL